VSLRAKRSNPSHSIFGDYGLLRHCAPRNDSCSLLGKKRGRGERLNTVIIGNGIAGNSAAWAIADASPDHKVTLLSQEPHAFYSPCVLARYLSGDIPRSKIFPRVPASPTKDNLVVKLGQKVTAIDAARKAVVLPEGNLSYDKLILATGAVSTVPDVKGVNKSRVFRFKTLDDFEAIKQHKATKAVVIGTGPMGVEAATALRKRGIEVALVGRRTRIMPRLFDDKPAALLAAAMVSHGVQMVTGESFREILGNGQAEAVLTDKRRIECDMVVLCVGVNPLVGVARQAGVQMGTTGGIKADHHMRTSVEGIYACGDCAETTDLIDGQPTLSLNWTAARRQGAIAGYNSAGLLRTYPGSLSMRSIVVFDLFAFAIGLGADRLCGR
ncbi:MAG: NAD(P)/FAD-dependent oxidoreductase, partial [Dehalococcoidia bacterium]|nr:NAD(P)/FAD-dependent oxidoreductase [Dehalococcoidia bacterium]